VSKDRAAPFSKKHRRYWIPVTGGMLLIGALNIGLGLYSFKAAPDPQHIELPLLHRDAGRMDAGDTIGNADLPSDVMRAFAVKYPRIIPAGAKVNGDYFVIAFPVGQAHAHATFSTNGTFVSED
jgi:hypothetical protein